MNSRILITTANTPYFNDFERDRLLLMLCELHEMLQRRGVDFEYRLFDTFLINALKAKYGSIVNSTALSLENQIEFFSSVITTPSSVSVTAAYHQRSVAVLVYRSEPLIQNYSWLIPDVGVFEHSLECFLAREPYFMRIQNAGLELDTANLGSPIETLDNILLSSESKGIDEYLARISLDAINSPFNFNVEYFVRKLYLFIKEVFKGTK